MSLPHALLTSLLEKPSTGYELARRFDKSIAYFWHASHQQIYRELARMEQQGWVAAQAIKGGRAGQRSYCVLDAGRAELIRWAQVTSPAPRLRDDLMVKLRADAALGSLDLISEFEQRLAQHEQELATYHSIAERDFHHLKPSRRQRLHQLILEAGIAYEEGRRAWTARVLETLRDEEKIITSKNLNIDNK